MSPDVIRFEEVRKTFRARGRSVAAVAGVSFGVAAGRVLGVVGESGSGKSTLANLLLRLEPPSDGRILWRGRDIAGLAGGELKAFRRAVQMVFQDPFGSLDPRFTVGRTVAEPLVIHGIGDRVSRRDRVVAALETAELRPGTALLDRLPHELSGGQRQRVAIARALVLDPEALVADEPVSMLDVSARAGILDLLRRLVAERGLALVFITHDLSLIGSICSEVAVMYRGRFVETGAPEALLEAPLHPYTRALIAAIPVPDPTARRVAAARAEGQDFGEAGCAYAPRCSEVGLDCAVAPPLVATASGRSVACVRRTVMEEAR